MLATLQRLLRQPALWRTLLISYVLLLTFMSMNPWIRPNPGPDDIIPEDKVGHFFGYLWLSLLTGAAFWKQMRQQSRLWSGPLLVVVAATLYGGLIEVAQATLTDYRSGEWSDVFANGVGAAAGGLVLAALLLRERIRSRGQSSEMG